MRLVISGFFIMNPAQPHGDKRNKTFFRQEMINRLHAEIINVLPGGCAGIIRIIDLGLGITGKPFNPEMPGKIITGAQTEQGGIFQVLIALIEITAHIRRE